MILFYSWEFWVGFISILSYMVIPHLYTAANIKDNFVWVPINNQHFLAGDNRFYAAGVNEARSNFFKYLHPCSNYLGRMSIDYTRSSSYRLAAILGLGIKDNRFAFFISFVLSVIFQFTLICILIYDYFSDSCIAVLGSLLVIYYCNILLSLISKEKIKTFIYHLSSVSNFSTFDRVNDNFRYVIMSSAGCFIWVSLLFGSYYYFIPNDLIKIASLFLILIPLLFVYPIVSVYSLFMILWIICNKIYSNGDWHEFYVLAIGLVVSAVLFFILGLHKKVLLILNSDLDVLIQSHVGKESYNYNFKSFFSKIFTDFFFLISLIALIFLNLNNSNYALDGIFIFMILLRLFGYVAKKNDLITRFYERGALHFFLYGFLMTIFIISKSQNNNFTQNIFDILLIFVAIIPLFKIIVSSKKLFKSKAFQLPKYEWELYSFMKFHTKKRSSFLAFSYSNLQLIPVYTNANLVIRGAEWLESPLTEISRYFKALEFLKINTIPFWEAFLNFHQLHDPKDTNCPLTEKKYTYYHLFKTLIYFPFVKQVGQVEIYDKVQNAWNKEFLELIKKELSKNDENFDLSVDYIVIDKNLIDNTKCNNNFILIFENLRFQLYKKRI
jgi:hypothetical protein